MFIIEGMDNAGKSRLAYQIGRQLKKVVIHSPGRKYGVGAMTKWAELTLNSPADSYVIYDRHPIISEAVYGQTLRGYNTFEAPEYRHILREFSETTNVIIYCRPPQEKIFNFQKEEMEGVVDHANELLKAYDRLFLYGEFERMNDKSLVVPYDWTKDEITKRISEGMGNRIQKFLGDIFRGGMQ